MTRRIDPRTVDLTFETSPPGLDLSVGSYTGTAPFTRTVLRGSSQGITADASQTLSGTTYAFTGWSDGGAAAHQITAPATATTYRATYTAQAGGPAGLVGAWGFDEASGPSAADASGRGNAGTIAGATRTASGRFGGALTFDGVNDLVTVPDAASLDLTTGMTLEAWVNPTALGTAWRTAMLKERGSGLAYALYAHDGAGHNAGYAFTGAERGVASPAALPLNAWTHVATTYDGTTLRQYVGGVQVASTAVSGALTVSTGALRFGGNNVWGEWFAGRLDELRVYNRALTAAEVAADVTRPVGPGPAAAAGGHAGVADVQRRPGRRPARGADARGRERRRRHAGLHGERRRAVAERLAWLGRRAADAHRDREHDRARGRHVHGERHRRGPRGRGGARDDPGDADRDRARAARAGRRAGLALVRGHRRRQRAGGEDARGHEHGERRAEPTPPPTTRRGSA